MGGCVTRSRPSDLGPDRMVLDPSADRQLEGPGGGTHRIVEIWQTRNPFKCSFISFSAPPVRAFPLVCAQDLLDPKPLCVAPYNFSAPLVGAI